MKKKKKTMFDYVRRFFTINPVQRVHKDKTKVIPRRHKYKHKEEE